jgi:hypothetical protein
MKAHEGTIRTGLTVLTVRRAGVAITAVFGVLLGWVSLAWACGLYTAPPMAAVSPSRTTAAAPLTVSGTGWQPATAVNVSLSTDGSTVVQPLGTPTPGADGTFSLNVRLADTAGGVYYVTATQGAARSNTPIEVTGRGALSPAGQWSGLATGADRPTITDTGHPSSGSTFPWTPVLLAAGVLACCCVLGAAELRRQRATS